MAQVGVLDEKKYGRLLGRYRPRLIRNDVEFDRLAAQLEALDMAGEEREFKFDKEGIIRIGCNLHANMSAYLVVVAAPAYVVTDDKGGFKFNRLAPGKYKLKAWSEKSKSPITQDITIKVGANSVNVGVAADAPSGPQPDKFGAKRG